MLLEYSACQSIWTNGDSTLHQLTPCLEPMLVLYSEVCDVSQAVEANRGDLVEQLVQSKAQLQARDGNGNTALHLAVRCKVELY